MIWPFLLIGLVAVALTLLFGWRRMYHRRRLLAGRSHPLAEEITNRSGELGWREIASACAAARDSLDQLQVSILTARPSCRLASLQRH